MIEQTKKKYKKPELVSPAGSLDKLKTAIEYGADAVYAGGKDFNLRNSAANFSLDEIGSAVEYVHKRGRKLYITLNIFAHNCHISRIEKYLKELAEYPVDAVIVADPGALALVREIMHETPCHISTQANCTNTRAADFWYKQGVKRVVLARELSLNEISEISSNSDCKTEVFVHGALCVAISGKCYMSLATYNSSANRGACLQNCRRSYKVIDEETGQELVLDNKYVMSPKDLCTIGFVDKLIEAGVSVFKIEEKNMIITGIVEIISTPLITWVKFNE